MGSCEDCGTEIDDKYIVCVSCLKKRNAANKKVAAEKGSDQVVSELGKLNNNLYALRTMLEFAIEETFEKKLVWSKKEKRFEIHELGKK